MNRTRIAAPAAVLLLLAAAFGCGSPTQEAPEVDASAAPAGPSAAAAVGVEEVPVAPAAEVGDLEIRSPRASLSPAGTGAVYLTVTSTGGEGDRLVGVTTVAADEASLHESVDEGGVHRMKERPEGFEVPAGGSVELAPGGKHVMLMGLADGAADGGSLPLTLRFESAGEVELEVPVEGPGATGHDHGEMDHEDMDHGEMDHDDMDHGDMDHEGMDHEGMGR